MTTLAKSLVLVLLVLFFVPAMLADPATCSQNSDYVILTNIPEVDPFYSAVSLLQNYRSALVIRFLDDVSEAVASLKAVMPEYVAVAVKPEMIDVDFAARTYLALSQLDDDQFLDCSVGFITGASAFDMSLLVNNTIAAEGKARPSKYCALIQSHSTFGGDGAVLNRSQVYSRFFSASGWATSLVDTYYKPADMYQRMSNCSITTIDMHGSPTTVELLTSAEIRNGSSQYLFPTVVLANPCYTAVTYRFFEESSKTNTTINPAESFSLSFLNRGAVGYIGHLRMTGANWYALEPVLYGMTSLGLSQGTALKQALNLGLVNYGVPANMTMQAAYFFGYVLYGDPKYVPLQHPLSDPIVSVNSTTYQNTVNVQLRFNRNVSFPKVTGGTYMYSNLTEWYQFSAALAQATFSYRLLLPANLTASNVALVSFSDPTDAIQNVYSQGSYVPLERTPEGTFVYLRTTVVFKNTTLAVWSLRSGLTVELNVYTIVIPEFPGGLFLLFAFLAASLVGSKGKRKIIGLFAVAKDNSVR